jgi:hypothetical protein
MSMMQNSPFLFPGRDRLVSRASDMVGRTAILACTPPAFCICNRAVTPPGVLGARTTQTNCRRTT